MTIGCSEDFVVEGNSIFVKLPENSNGMFAIEIGADNMKNPTLSEFEFSNFRDVAMSGNDDHTSDDHVSDNNASGNHTADNHTSDEMIALSDDADTTSNDNTNKVVYSFNKAEVAEGFDFATVDVAITDDAGYDMDTIGSALSVYDASGTDVTSDCSMKVIDNVIIIDGPVNIDNVSITL